MHMSYYFAFCYLALLFFKGVIQSTMLKKKKKSCVYLSVSIILLPVLYGISFVYLVHHYFFVPRIVSGT